MVAKQCIKVIQSRQVLDFSFWYIPLTITIKQSAQGWLKLKSSIPFGENMYSPFNSKSRCEFIRKEFEQEYIAFPKVIDEAYSAVINWLFTLGDPDFDKNKAKLKDDDMDDDMSNTASQFSCYLPSHAIKAYQTLLRIDEPIGLLGKPQITFIDIGCGGGAASIGLISLVINYQTYRKANNLPVFPIEIYD